MENDVFDPKLMNDTWCFLYGGPKNCLGHLHMLSFKLYDADGNELTDENRYTSKPHFKCKCDKCGHEAFLPYDPDAPTILY